MMVGMCAGVAADLAVRREHVIYSSDAVDHNSDAVGQDSVAVSRS